MKKYQFTFYEKGCKKIFKTYKHQEKIIKDNIIQQVSNLVNNDFNRIKPASKKRINNFPLYECRVNLPKIPDIRNAFFINQDKINVIYITNNITKADFTAEIEKFIDNHSTIKF